MLVWRCQIINIITINKIAYTIMPCFLKQWILGLKLRLCWPSYLSGPATLFLSSIHRLPNLMFTTNSWCQFYCWACFTVGQRDTVWSIGFRVSMLTYQGLVQMRTDTGFPQPACTLKTRAFAVHQDNFYPALYLSNWDVHFTYIPNFIKHHILM